MLNTTAMFINLAAGEIVAPVADGPTECPRCDKEWGQVEQEYQSCDKCGYPMCPGSGRADAANEPNK